MTPAPTLLCRASRSVLAGSGDLPRWAESHVETCLACQAEAARYHQVQRGMRLLASGSYDAPPGLVGQVMAALDDPQNRDHRAVIFAAVAAGVAAGIVGVAAMRSRTR